MEQSRAWVQALRENIGKVLVGKDETINLVLTVNLSLISLKVHLQNVVSVS